MIALWEWASKVKEGRQRQQRRRRVEIKRRRRRLRQGGIQLAATTRSGGIGGSGGC